MVRVPRFWGLAAAMAAAPTCLGPTRTGPGFRLCPLIGRLSKSGGPDGGINPDGGCPGGAGGGGVGGGCLRKNQLCRPLHGLDIPIACWP